MGLKQTLLSAVGPRLATRGTIVAVEAPSDRFRFIDIESEKLSALGPAHKAQINVGEWNMRTYTPMAAGAGRMRVLAYLHAALGSHPGSSWARQAAAGRECWFLPPKATIDTPVTAKLFVGDETSFATALNLQREGQHGDVKYLFEVSSLNEARRAMDALGLQATALVERRGDDAHWATFTEQAASALAPASTERAILTGSAQTIAAISRALRAKGISSSRVSIKPYWSRLKVGLD